LPYEIPLQNNGGHPKSLTDPQEKVVFDEVRAREENSVKGPMDAEDIVKFVKKKFQSM